MRKLEPWLRVLLPIGAALCFVLTLLLAASDRVGPATLMAGMFIVCLLMYYLPEMESFKAYGIEAKMRATLSEAEKVLGQVRALALMAGKLTYHSLGWQSRMAHPIREKQALADEVDKVLESAGVAAADLKAIKQQYLRFILWDLDHKFFEVVRNALEKQSHLVQCKLHRAGITPDEAESLKAQVTRLNAEEARLTKWRGLSDDITFKGKLRETSPVAGVLDDELQKAVDMLRERIERVGDECMKSGRLTDEGAELILKDGRELAKQVGLLD